jgi:hypothetical protein
MKKLLLIFLTLLGVGGVCAEQTMKVDIDSLQGYFKKIEATDQGLAFTFKKEGGRLLWSMDGSDNQKSKYGETVTIPYGSSLRFVGKHEVIELTPVKGRRAFVIHQQFNARSFGGELSKGEAVLLVSEEALQGKPGGGTHAKRIQFHPVADLEKIKAGEIK